jgi:RNA 3'-terminal phosphate cyclase (GTP)
LAFATDTLAGRQVAERMAAAAKAELKECSAPIDIATAYGPAYNPGAGIVLWAPVNTSPAGMALPLGADALGERGKPAEAVGREAAARLSQALSSSASVDEYLSDQLVPYLGLVPGSRMQVAQRSGHLLSNIEVAQRFLPVRFKWDGPVVAVEVK